MCSSDLDTTVSVAVKLRDEEDAYAVFWTTTPWTVPTNFAIVVGADIEIGRAPSELQSPDHLVCRLLLEKLAEHGQSELLFDMDDSVDQVKEMGIDKFNDACRASVLKYTNANHLAFSKQIKRGS